MTSSNDAGERSPVRTSGDADPDLQRLPVGLQVEREDERARIVRELRNGPMQALAALAVQARLAERGEDVAALKLGIGRLRQGIGEVLDALSRLSRELSTDRSGKGERPDVPARD